MKNNKEQINRKSKRQKYLCDCGSELRISNKARHERSLKHQNYIQNLN
jgi:hypothetical protein